MCEWNGFWTFFSLKKNQTNVSKIHTPTWVGHFVKYENRHNITQPYVKYPQVQHYQFITKRFRMLNIEYGKVAIVLIVCFMVNLVFFQAFMKHVMFYLTL
jgi:hypothetical protein